MQNILRTVGNGFWTQAPRSTLRTLCVQCRNTSKFIFKRYASNSSNAAQSSTPLGRLLARVIQERGPIPLPDYIKQCLTHPKYGYYTTSPDPFGQQGDFTTSPEISQMFGEIIGIWILIEWIAWGSPTEWDIVELGPGRGTLMSDILRTLAKVKIEKCFESLRSVHLVEASPILREKQRDKIKVTLSRYGGSQMPIHFHDSFIDLLKSSNPLRHPLILAHEFLDALPIHAFQLQSPRAHGSSTYWRELFVTNEGSIDAPEFSLTPFTTETLASRSLPMSDLRYSKTQFKPGTRIEISAEAVQLTHSITSLVVNGAREFPTPSPTPQMSSSLEPTPSGSGTALFIDYGPLDGIPSESLRGIHEHKFTSPFERPGMQDLTADVDFGCIRDTALSVPGARVSGPTPQGDFLLNMGLEFRAQRLIQTGKVTEDKREAIIKEVQRLAGKEKGQMGAVYNVMAITSRKTASDGFGGVTSPS